ncbi:hypothetical protein PInf_023484 [Phytophthora infestans]|nr:hypothetical protein PInf_023484 [Phytophthora infestans]
MAPRPRSAQKSPLTLEGIDSDSASNDSDGSVSDWQPVSSPTSAEAEAVTSSASEESGQISILASPPQETQFQSWKDFEAYLALYQAQSLQGSAATKIPAEWDQYAKTYVCTHHGTYRSQATSKRPRQETRAQGCSAQLNVCVQEINKAEHTFVLKVTKCRLEHNHSLNEYAFKSHPSNRITLDDSALRTVNELRKAGAKKTSILKFIRDNSDSNPKPQDVHNLVSKLKARENRNGPSSSAKRLKKWMAEFGDNVGNVGRIFVDDVGEKKIATY